MNWEPSIVSCETALGALINASAVSAASVTSAAYSVMNAAFFQFAASSLRRHEVALQLLSHPPLALLSLPPELVYDGVVCSIKKVGGRHLPLFLCR